MSRGIMFKQRIWAFIIILLLLIFPFITKLSCGHIVYFLISIGWVVIVKNKSFFCLGLSRINFVPSIAISIIISGLLALAAGLILNLTGLEKIDINSTGIYDKIESMVFLRCLPVKSASMYMLKQSKSVKGLIYYFLYMVFFVGLGEELFWRGLVQNNLLSRFSKLKAIVITTVLFTSIHLYLFIIVPLWIGIVFLLMIALASLFWGYMLYYFKNIWCVGLSHGIVACVIWRFYFFKL